MSPLRSTSPRTSSSTSSTVTTVTRLCPRGPSPTAISTSTRPWQRVTHGDICDLKYRVRLCLEGVPLHAWNESFAKRAVARACDLDYVEKSSLDRADTRALCVWAWTHNPSDIPKET